MAKIEEGLFSKLIDNVNDGIYFLNTERKVTYWNQASEWISGYKEDEVIGKRCSENILVHINEWGENLCDKNCPVKETLADGKVHETRAYLQHKEGYRIPIMMRAIPIKDKGGKTIGAIEIFRDDSPRLAVPQRIKELEHMALLDTLTKVGNKRYAEIHLEARLNEMSKYQIPFSVLYADVDDLQEINKTFGTVVGDKILKMVAQTISNNIRFFDFVGRWEDDKIVVIASNIEKGKLDFIANKLRLLIGASNISLDTKTVQATISIGATQAKLSDNLESLINRCCQLMQKSKKAGKNCVSLG